MKTHAIETAAIKRSPRAPSKKFLIQTPNGFRWEDYLIAFELRAGLGITARELASKWFSPQAGRLLGRNEKTLLRAID